MSESETHYPSVSMNWSRNGRVMWAKASPANAIVFVHGFNGDTLTTFKDLPALLAVEKKASRYDVFLFGYNSLKLNAGAAAEDLVKFLEALGTDAKGKIMDTAVPPKWRRSGSFQYSRILIVAHSLGAIVSRLALLRVGRRSPPSPWLSRVELVLYAPAHLGATLEELVRESFLGPFASLFKAKIPVLNTLRKDSPLIRELERDSRQIIQQGGSCNHVKARKVIHSQTDNVVEADARFCEDPDPDYVEEHRTHSSVCKAEVPQARPFAHLVEVL